jgi:gliding motility-associated-like protein
MKLKNLIALIFVIGMSTLFGQITPNGNSGAATTSYTNGAVNDPIYIWCADGLSNNTASLTATPSSGTGPYTFNWYYHNQTNSSWTDYLTFTGATSTISGLASDGYRVQIYDNAGALVGCFTAWVWNMNSDVTASQTPSACNATGLSGSISANSSFTYYNPPPPESTISASTQISVCFTATHTYVSDLAFYLVGPPACGSPTILLSPNPGANGQGSVCNSNNNVSNLCFTTSAAPNFDPCNEQCCGFMCLNVTSCTSTYSGTYDSYGPSSTPINWSALYGCNAAQGGWAVQIYDCIGADVGSLTNATISFSNLTSVCGSPTSLNYSSGALNSSINDNSCAAGTASIFQVPVSTALSTPITINANTSYLWSSSPIISIPNATTSLTPSVSSIPAGTTDFTLTATVSYGTANCTNVETVAFINTCCSATANAGNDVSFCTGGTSILGTSSVAGMTYAWSPSTGLSSATVAQPSVTLTNVTGSTQTTVYTLTVTNTLNGNCTATDAVNVAVNPLPTVSAGSYSPVCSTAATVALVGAPAGGIYTGLGVTGTTFNTSSGTQTITYSYSNALGCSNSATALITVNQQPVVSAGNYSIVCSNAPDIALVGSPIGGTFSGTGVTGWSFDPSAGTQSILYSYTDGNGCSNEANTTITVNTLPIVSAGIYVDQCANAPLLTLVGSPVGGSFSGVGVSAGQFNPASGTSSVAYNYTDANGCSNSASTVINVNPVPLVSGGNYPNVCANAALVALTGTPVGGTFTGTGVTGLNFDPAVGTQTLTYNYTDGFGCSTSTITTITVVNPAAINAGTYSPVCVDAPNIALVGSPSGGTFSGTGVNSNVFDPTFGTQLITYNYTDPAGCSGSGSTTITVNPLPIVDAGVYNPVCSNGSTVTLIGTPVGGVYSGTGVTGSSFNPTSGTQTITYSYTNLNGCSNSDVATIIVNPAPVVSAGTYLPVCLNGAPVNLVGTPPGGTFSGTGIAANTFNPASGTQTIMYSYTSPQNCTNTSNATIQVNNLPVINGGSDVTICTGSSITLSGNGGISYSWNNGGVNGQAFTPAAGLTIYTVSGTDANGCVNTDNVTVNALPYPSAVASADVTTGNPGLVVNFDNFSINSTSYNWDFGNGASSSVNDLNSQTATYNSIGTYFMVLTASNGLCADTAMIQIDVLPFPNPLIYVPNVFTPNGDNANDNFYISTQHAAAIEVVILNRWGNVMHEITTLDGVWNGDVNGKQADDGVYFFKYKVTSLYGEEIVGHGNITLIR